MTRTIPLLLAALMILGACVPATTNGFDLAATQVAVQRMRFAVEAVCLNNRTRAAQDRAARALGFPLRERQGDGVNYINPATLTFLRLAPTDVQTLTLDDGTQRQVRGSGCSVGSPAVSVDAANRVVGEILAPRLVEGDQRITRPVGAGENDARGVGLFFDDLTVTVPLGTTTFTNDDGEGLRFVHPVILIVHGGR